MFDKRILDEISNSKGYSIALLTTFNFEISYFERTILNSLYDKNIRNIELFVDADELEKAISESIDNNLNKKYIANPIRINSAFHPKVVLLLGEEKAKLIVASANIKTSGYTLNNEIYNVFEYNKDNTDNISLINDAISFFERLNDMSYYQDTKLFKMIDDLLYRHRKSDNNDIKLIQNLDTSVLDQIKEIITDKVISIDIAVPYFDNELLGYRDLSQVFNCNDINIYLQNGLSTFPVDFNNENSVVNDGNIYTYLKLKNNGKKNFYHGKVFRINTINNSYILYGSSNCTLSALSKTYHNGGNVECNILEIGQKTDFDYFFDNFEIEIFEELTCNILEYEPKEKTNFSFKYGIKKEDIKLYLSYKNKIDNLQIRIGEKVLNYEYLDNELIVTIDKSTADELNNIFDINITEKDDQEIIRCWYFDIDTVENYRNAERKTSFDDIDVDEDMEKYREHMELIVRTLALTKDEYSEHIKLQKMLNKKSNLENQEDLDEDEIDDDFIVDKDIPDEYIRKNKDFTNAYIKSRLFSDRFFKGLKLRENGSGSQTSSSDKKESNDNPRKKRPATPAEKRFERFIKSRVKGILRDEYVELVDYDHYKNSIGVVLDVINEYKYKEQVEDIFDDRYVIDISLELINKLLEKETPNHSDDEKESTIILALILILENHIINNSEENKDYKVELQNKDIIKKLNQLFDIRESFEELLKYAVENINANIRTIDYDYYKSYIESLFGYKTKVQLLDIIRNKLDSNAEINTSEDIVYIKFSTLDIGKYFKLDSLIINEIRNHYKNQNMQLNGIKIEIYNDKNDYPETANPVKLIVYDIEPNGLYIKTMTYKDGKVLPGKQERI